MKKTSILTAAVAAAAMFSLPVLHAQTAAPVQNCPTPVKHHGKKKPAVAPCADFESQLAKQQAEIDALKAQIAGQQPAPAAAGLRRTQSRRLWPSRPPPMRPMPQTRPPLLLLLPLPQPPVRMPCATV